MTREKMAERLHSLSGFAHASEFDVLSSAADELRKTCGNCEFFIKPWSSDYKFAVCRQGQNMVPADGSGFCHRWEPKP